MPSRRLARGHDSIVLSSYNDGAAPREHDSFELRAAIAKLARGKSCQKIPD